MRKVYEKEKKTYSWDFGALEYATLLMSMFCLLMRALRLYCFFTGKSTFLLKFMHVPMRRLSRIGGLFFPEFQAEPLGTFRRPESIYVVSVCVKHSTQHSAV